MDPGGGLSRLKHRQAVPQGLQSSEVTWKSTATQDNASGQKYNHTSYIWRQHFKKKSVTCQSLATSGHMTSGRPMGSNTQQPGDEREMISGSSLFSDILAEQICEEHPRKSQRWRGGWNKTLVSFIITSWMFNGCWIWKLLCLWRISETFVFSYIFIYGGRCSHNFCQPF